MSECLRVIEVVCAVVRRGNRVLACRRAKGRERGLWEFPGGKIEAGELPEQALAREMWEELQMRVTVQSALNSVDWPNGEVLIRLRPYWCECDGEEREFTLIDHDEIRWLSLEEGKQLDWLPADVTIWQEVEDFLKDLYER